MSGRVVTLGSVRVAVREADHGPVYSLATEIAESRSTPAPRWGMTAAGYTGASGAPSSLMVRIAGETRWRRLMVYQISNAGSCFLRIRGLRVWVDDLMVPDPGEGPALARAFRLWGALAWAVANDTARDRAMVASVRAKVEAGDMTGARISCAVLAGEIADPAIRQRIEADRARMEAADAESRAFMAGLRRMRDAGVTPRDMTREEIAGWGQ